MSPNTASAIVESKAPLLNRLPNDPLASSGYTTDNVNSSFDGQTEEKILR